MNQDQTLKHTVSTEITSTVQTVRNETIFTEGGEIVLSAVNEINLPIGAEYDIQVSGDINADSIRRSLNLANNLVGQNVFKFTNTNQATDTDNITFAAAYDVETMILRGTAPLKSMVRIVFEDGTNTNAEPDELGNWQYSLDENNLQVGTNNIIIFIGTKPQDMVIINVDKAAPYVPLDKDFTAILGQDNKTVSGMVEDSRAKVYITSRLGNVTAQPGPDLSWSWTSKEEFIHGDKIQVYIANTEERSEAKELTCFKFSYLLDEAGYFVSGTAPEPHAQVSIVTDSNNILSDVADLTGNWTIALPYGLQHNEVVTILINTVESAKVTYTGQSAPSYPLSFQILDNRHLAGKARPDLEVNIEINGASSSTFPDSNGDWQYTLPTALVPGEIVKVSTIRESLEATYIMPFEGYLANDGLSVFGTANGPEVTITLPGQDAKTVQVIDYEWKLALDTALNPGELVTIGHNGALTTLTFTEIQKFTAFLTSANSVLEGVTDPDCLLRIIMDDNSTIEQQVSGPYSVALGRNLAAGQAVVVACINTHGVQAAKELYAE